MAGEGQILREARLEKGLDLTQVEQDTKIRIRYIEALEEENYKVLPGPTYVKGFLRTYAKFLGVSYEEIIALYKSSEALEEPIKINEATNSSLQKKLQLKRPAVLVLSGLLTVVIVIAIASFTGSNGKNTASSYTPPRLPSAPQTAELEPKETAEETQPAQVQPPNNSTETPIVATAEPEKLKAELVFTDNCWVQVNVDDKPALSGTFQQGTTKELTAEEKIELVTVGNAGGISITLNGKPYPSLGTTGEVVNNVVIKKDLTSQISFNY